MEFILCRQFSYSSKTGTFKEIISKIFTGVIALFKDFEPLLFDFFDNFFEFEALSDLEDLIYKVLPLTLLSSLSFISDNFSFFLFFVALVETMKGLVNIGFGASFGGEIIETFNFFALACSKGFRFEIGPVSNCNLVLFLFKFSDVVLTSLWLVLRIIWS